MKTENTLLPAIFVVNSNFIYLETGTSLMFTFVSFYRSLKIHIEISLHLKPTLPFWGYLKIMIKINNTHLTFDYVQK